MAAEFGWIEMNLNDFNPKFQTFPNRRIGTLIQRFKSIKFELEFGINSK
jgi:hypothetical protein